MSKTFSWLRKIVVALVGVPLFVVGIILIPLPGPGLLVCFAALFILSLEFEWTEPHRQRAQAELKKIIDKSRARSDKIKDKADK